MNEQTNKLINMLSFKIEYALKTFNKGILVGLGYCLINLILQNKNENNFKKGFYFLFKVAIN